MNNTIENTTAPITTTWSTILTTTVDIIAKFNESLILKEKYINVTEEAQVYEIQTVLVENKDTTENNSEVPRLHAVSEYPVKVTEDFTEFCDKRRLEWWAYMIMAVVAFLVLLLLHFIVIKINDSRMEERCARLHRKDSPCTQVISKSKLNKTDYDGTKKVDRKSSHSLSAGVSLIYSQSDNDRLCSRTTTSNDPKKDCREVAQNAGILIDTIYKDSGLSHIIRGNPIESNDAIKETELASGDANPRTVTTEMITRNNNPSDTLLDIENNKSNVEIKATRKRFHLFGKIRMPPRKFIANDVSTVIDEDNDIEKTITSHGNSTGGDIIMNDNRIEKEVDNKSDDTKRITKVVVKNIENEITPNGSNSN